MQKREVLGPNIILGEIQALQPIVAGKSEAEMLKPDAIIEMLLVGEVFQLVLVFHFVLDVFALVNVLQSNPVL